MHRLIRLISLLSSNRIVKEPPACRPLSIIELTSRRVPRFRDGGEFCSCRVGKVGRTQDVTASLKTRGQLQPIRVRWADMRTATLSSSANAKPRRTCRGKENPRRKGLDSNFPVNVVAAPHVFHCDDPAHIVDREDDPIVANPDSKQAAMIRQLFHPRGSGVRRQAHDLFIDPLAFPLCQLCESPACGSGDLETVRAVPLAHP